MRRYTPVLMAALFAACGGAEDDMPEAEMPAAETEPAAVSVSDFAGTWRTVAMIEGTPDPVMSTLSSSDDGSGWTMTLEDRDPVALTASMSGDSLVLMSDPYESILREGVTVTVRTAGVLSDGRLVGKMIATYQTPDGQEVVSGTIESTRSGM